MQAYDLNLISSSNDDSYCLIVLKLIFIFIIFIFIKSNLIKFIFIESTFIKPKFPGLAFFKAFYIPSNIQSLVKITDDDIGSFFGIRVIACICVTLFHIWVLMLHKGVSNCLRLDKVSFNISKVSVYVAALFMFATLHLITEGSLQLTSSVLL